MGYLFWVLGPMGYCALGTRFPWGTVSSVLGPLAVLCAGSCPD